MPTSAICVSKTRCSSPTPRASLGDPLDGRHDGSTSGLVTRRRDLGAVDVRVLFVVRVPRLTSRHGTWPVVGNRRAALLLADSGSDATGVSDERSRALAIIPLSR